MDFFEFLLIITSVIYALCMAPLLSGFVRVLQFDGEVKYFLPQILLSLYLLIFEPVLLYVACALVFPNKLDGDQFDMETHYYKVRVPILTVVLLAVTLVFVDGVVVGLESVWHGRRYAQVLTMGLLIWALIDVRRISQYTFTLGVLASMFVLVAQGFWVPAA